jgi:hypothetical protein
MSKREREEFEESEGPIVGPSGTACGASDEASSETGCGVCEESGVCERSDKGLIFVRDAKMLKTCDGAGGVRNLVAIMVEDTGEGNTSGACLFGFLPVRDDFNIGTDPAGQVVLEKESANLASFICGVLDSPEWNDELEKFPVTPVIELYGCDGDGTLTVTLGTEGMKDSLNESRMVSVFDKTHRAGDIDFLSCTLFGLCRKLVAHYFSRKTPAALYLKVESIPKTCRVVATLRLNYRSV